MKSNADIHGGGAPSHEHLNSHSSNDLEELEDEDDSDSNSPPLPYLQAPAPDGCCTLDGNNPQQIKKTNSFIRENASFQLVILWLY